MKPTKANSQLANKRPFYTKEVMIRPYPPLFKIYQSYAQILNASQLPTHFQHDVSLISATAPAPAELFATDNFLLVYIAQQQNIRIKARSIVEADVDLIQVQYQLSNTLFKLMTELKINPQALNPDKLLHNLNQSLSKQAIYDVNQKLYDKPRCSLSRDLFILKKIKKDGENAPTSIIYYYQKVDLMKSKNFTINLSLFLNY